MHERRGNPEAALSDLTCLYPAGNATLAYGYEYFAFQAIKPYFYLIFYYKTTSVARIVPYFLPYYLI